MEFLEKETGYFFESAIPTSYIAVVESMGSQRADIAIMNSFGYLMANERYGAKALMTAIRYGTDSYQGMIVARKDSGIESVADLNGKSFAFTDSSSTSGYLFPLKILKENNISLGNTVFAMKHDSVVTMVYQKQVDAGACFYSPPDEEGHIRDARSKVATQFPDIEDQVKVLVKTESILNDPFVFRKEMTTEMTDKIVGAIKKFLESPEGRASFSKSYGFDGAIPAKDSDYDGLRQMLATTNIDINELVK